MRRNSPSCASQNNDASAKPCLRQFPKEGGPGWYRAHNRFIDEVAPRVGAFAAAVYHVLCRHSRGERIKGVSVAQIARNLKLGRTAVFAALSKLEKHKAIRRLNRPGSESDYELLDLRSHANPSASRAGDTRQTNRGCSCGERLIRNARLRDSNSPYPPFQGG